MAVNFDRGERNFGSDAYALVSRKPKQTFTKMTTMLGKSPQEKTWHELFMLMVRGASAFECVANLSMLGYPTTLEREEAQFLLNEAPFQEACD